MFEVPLFHGSKTAVDSAWKQRMLRFKITSSEKLYLLFFVCVFNPRRVRFHQGIWKDDSRYLPGYLFVAVLILYTQDSSVKRGYHTSKDIII